MHLNLAALLFINNTRAQDDNKAQYQSRITAFSDHSCSKDDFKYKLPKWSIFIKRHVVVVTCVHWVVWNFEVRIEHNMRFAAFLFSWSIHLAAGSGT